MSAVRLSGWLFHVGAEGIGQAGARDQRQLLGVDRRRRNRCRSNIPAEILHADPEPERLLGQEHRGQQADVADVRIHVARVDAHLEDSGG